MFSVPFLMAAPTALDRRRIRVHRAVAVAVCLGLGGAGCGTVDSASSPAALTKPNPVPASALRTGAGGANTAQVVAAANAFLATLSDEQKDTALYDFDDPAKKTGWSNFPTPVVERNGLKLGDLTDTQEAAALKVMEAALSKKGYEELVEIRKADDYLASLPDTGGPGGGTPTGTPTATPTATPTGGGRPPAEAAAPTSARSGTTSPSSERPASPGSSRSSTAVTTPPTTSRTPAAA